MKKVKKKECLKNQLANINTLGLLRTLKAFLTQIMTQN